MSVVVAVDVVELADTETPGTNENQDTCDCHEAERNAFALPALIWTFFCSVNIIVCHILIKNS